MERKTTLLFFLFFLLYIPLFLHTDTIHAFQDFLELDDNNAPAFQLDYELVYLNPDICKTILDLKNLLPQYRWSPSFKILYLDIENDCNVTFYKHAETVIKQCLQACKNIVHGQRDVLQTLLKEYQKLLYSGKAFVMYSDLDDESEQIQIRGCCKSSKVKKICKLSVECLSVVGKLFVSGVDFSLLTGIAGAVGLTGPEGAQGIAGVLGAIGAAGPEGAQGIAGVIGAIGAAGAAGAAGVPGIPGAPGAQGIPGLPGVGGILGYGYIYNFTAQSVAIEAPIIFDSNGLLAGITHATPSASIVIVTAGTYHITFSVSGTEPNQFALFVNGTAVAQTVYGSGAGTQQNTGNAILALGANDVLTVVNHSSAAAVGLASVVGGTQANVNASVTILRLT